MADAVPALSAQPGDGRGDRRDLGDVLTALRPHVSLTTLRDGRLRHPIAVLPETPAPPRLAFRCSVSPTTALDQPGGWRRRGRCPRGSPRSRPGRALPWRADSRCRRSDMLATARASAAAPSAIECRALINSAPWPDEPQAPFATVAGCPTRAAIARRQSRRLPSRNPNMHITAPPIIAPGTGCSRTFLATY